MPSTPHSSKFAKLFSLVGPGILVAATGVGAGDLATAGFAGSQLGVAVLWAILVGAFFKFVLTEGLMRWQLATGKTLLEGVARHLGPIPGWLFLVYFILWSYFVGSALISANGVALLALVPVFDNPMTGKIVLGAAASILGLILARKGGFKLFEKVMGVCILIMFVTVAISAVIVAPSLSELAKGLVIPSIPKINEGGIGWTLALMGGVGGTVTILCYGYWITEEGRKSPENLSFCRIDLGIGYLVTALFGIAMTVIGSNVVASGSGAGLIVNLADALAESVGPAARWAFLIGALGAVFSSLLGVWQSTPYLFADLWRLFVEQENIQASSAADTSSKPYRFFQYALAFVPTLGLLVEFKEVQKIYGIAGALFLPMLTIALLILNGRKKWTGDLTNRPMTTATLVSILGFFSWMAWRSWFG